MIDSWTLYEVGDFISHMPFYDSSITGYGDVLPIKAYGLVISVKPHTRKITPAGIPTNLSEQKVVFFDFHSKSLMNFITFSATNQNCEILFDSNGFKPNRHLKINEI